MERLRRHRELFPQERLPGSLGLLWHELRARRGLDLLLAPLLHLPYAGSALRSWFRARVVCAFVAFRDRSETTVGCLLHPERWGGIDRRRLAFRLLQSVGCGSPDYLCDGALRFEAATPAAQRGFQIAVRKLDWFHYSRAASSFTERKGGTPCPSSSTRPST